MSCNFGLKSYLWFQIELALRACSILKLHDPVWLQTKLLSTQFNCHYKFIWYDHVLNSFDHSVLWSMDMTKKKIMLISRKDKRDETYIGEWKFYVLSTRIRFCLKKRKFLVRFGRMYPLKTITQNASFQKRSPETRFLKAFLMLWMDEFIFFYLLRYGFRYQ